MHTTKAKKLLCLVLSLMMILTAAPLTGMTAFAEDHTHVDANKDNICDECEKELYIVRSWDDTKKKVVETLKEIPADAVTLESSEDDVTLEGKTYVVSGDVSMSANFNVNGTSDAPTILILKDGSKLNVSKRIYINTYKVLIICAQAKDSGAINGDQGIYIYSPATSDTETFGTLTINGGTITAKGSARAAIGGTNGVGANFGHSGGFITINGGIVTATSTSGAAIGGGSTNYPDYGSGKNGCGTITINGGVVTATSSAGGAGIGSGKYGFDSNVVINGGTVTATGSGGGAGIGGGLGRFDSDENGNGGTVTVNGGTVTATGSSSDSTGDAVSAGIGAGAYGKDQGTLNIAGNVIVKAGDAAPGTETTAADYITARSMYVYIGTPPHTHTFENGVCTDCGYKCTHTFEDGTCTVCGMADKITASELCALLKGQKFVNSDGLVLSIMDYGTVIIPVFGTSNLSAIPATDKVSVTSYGYSMTFNTTNAQGKFTNVFDFYTDADGISKVVCSGLAKEERNGEYYPYHPVTEVSAKAATCTENGYTTTYWVCTDEGCGKAFTDVSCKTEIPAETLATYIIPATGHDFTGEYVPGTGDNVGKHARKCVNTGCTAVGLGTTANAYEECTGMEDDFTCDICGYVDEAAAAAAALAAAKTEAKATVNALAGEGASDAVKAIVDKAVEDIEAAANESAITVIVANAESKVAVQKELEAVIAAKKADLTTALASAWTDDAKAILNKALTDIETATTITQANTISSSALGQAQGKDNEFNNLLNIYKNNFVNALTGNTLAEADNYLATVIAGFEACTNTTDLIAAYQAALPAMQFYVAMESIDNHYDYLNDFDGITDETKALAADAIEVLRTAKDIDEYNELCAEYDEKVYLAAVKDNTIFAIHEFIVTEDDSDEVTAIIEKAIADIKAAESQDEVMTAYLDAAAAVEAQRQAEAEAAAALAEAKEEAKAAVEALASDDDSDEVKAIVEKALADIENAKNIAAVEAIAETAAEDVADQRAAEALAEAKADAKTAVEALAGDTASDEVKAIVEKALADIEAAENEAAVEAVVTAAEKVVADQKAAEEAAKALTEAKEAAKAEIDAALADNADEAVKAAAEEAKAAIDNAKSISEVEAAKAAGLEKMEKASGACPYCGQKEHKNWIDKLFCIIKMIVKLIVMVFDFGEEIKAL